MSSSSHSSVSAISRSATKRPSGTAKTVLVAEDDPSIRRLLGRALEGAGYDVLLAEDGDDAIQCVKTYSPDLILLDVMMPRANGLSVARHLGRSESTSSIPIVFVTAMEDRRTVLAALELGVNSYITKPFNISRLLQTVETVIGWRH